MSCLSSGIKSLISWIFWGNLGLEIENLLEVGLKDRICGWQCEFQDRICGGQCEFQDRICGWRCCERLG